MQHRSVPELVRVSHGLWRPAENLEGAADRYAALLSVLPAGTVIAGLAAAQLQELWLLSWAEFRTPEFIFPAGARRPCERAGTRRAEVRGRRRALRSSEVTIVADVPVTSLARTWIDIAPVLGLPDLVAAGDCALRRGAVVEELEEATARARRQRGVVRARHALSLLSGRSRSRAESHLRVALVEGGLPAPEVNVAIHNDFGEWLAEPDLVYREARLALEYNGADHAEVGRMRRDITRTLDVDGSGWRAVAFGPAEVFGRPDSVATYVRVLLDERDPTWRSRAPIDRSPS